MVLTHKCSSGRTDVSIVREGSKINILRTIENSFSEPLINDVRFCPFCGVNLKEITKVGR